EDVLELVHARVREQQRRVVLRDERRALDHAVAALLEVAEDPAPDVVGRLQALPSAGSTGSSPSSASAQRGQSALSRACTRPAAKPRRSRKPPNPGSRRGGATDATVTP